MPDERNTNVLGRPGAALDRAMLSMTGQQPAAVEVIPDNALLYLENGDIEFHRFRITPVGLVMPDDVTNDELIAVGQILDSLDTAVQWNQSDWFNQAENRVWGQMYQSDAELKYETLKDYAWVARNVHLSIRNRQLSFAHHRAIAPLSEYPELQWYWLQYAATRTPKRLKIEQFKREMRALESLTVAECIAALTAAIDDPAMVLSKRSDLKIERQPKPEYLKNWKASRNVVDKALSGEVTLTRDQFEQALQDYVNKARIMWAFQARSE